MVAYTSNPSTGKAEAGGSLQVSDCSGVCSKILSHKIRGKRDYLKFLFSKLCVSGMKRQCVLCIELVPCNSLDLPVVLAASVGCRGFSPWLITPSIK